MNWNGFKSLQVQNNKKHLRMSVNQSESSIQPTDWPLLYLFIYFTVVCNI